MSTIALQIRTAEPRDAGALARVHEAAWRDAYAGILPHRSLTRMIQRRRGEWWARAIRSRLPMLVMEFGGEIIGYTTFGRRRTGALPAEAEIYEFYLNPEHQGLGFGTRLLARTRADLVARALSGLAVWAIEENERAVRFYECRGGRRAAESTESFEGRTLRKVAFLWP